MALTIDSSSAPVAGNLGPNQIIKAQIDLDASYATGGYDLSALLSARGLSDAVPYAISWDGVLASGRVFTVDSTTGNLIVLDNAGAQIANTTDLSAMVNIVVHIQLY